MAFYNKSLATTQQHPTRLVPLILSNTFTQQVCTLFSATTSITSNLQLETGRDQIWRSMISHKIETVPAITYTLCFVTTVWHDRSCQVAVIDQPRALIIEVAPITGAKLIAWSTSQPVTVLPSVQHTGKHSRLSMFREDTLALTCRCSRNCQ